MTRPLKKLILLEFNEVNFNFLKEYINRGFLPNFKRFLEEHGYQETTSEEVYEHIEPWIQWVSVHSGMPFKDHKIFRLGDIVGSKVPQIWEELEARGLKVGAISPMNAENRLKNPAFFMPDPWTPTKVSGSFLLRKIYQAAAQGVVDNAANRVAILSKLYLFLGLIVYGNKSNFQTYFQWLFQSKKDRWVRALLLDRLLADIFLRLWKKSQPDFSSLFLNGAAHIQHHYMFSSQVYSGPRKNPNWYVKMGKDPLLEVYQLYDDMLGDILKLNRGQVLNNDLSPIHVMLATGLRQDPYEKAVYYYRLKNHAQFIQKLGIQYENVEPRMSRDFVIRFSSEKACDDAEDKLNFVTDKNGIQLFEVDNRGLSLFVTLGYPNEIPSDFVALFQDKVILNFGKQVVFVALKNADHNGTGYFSDSSIKKTDHHPVFPVWQIKDKILAAFS